MVARISSFVVGLCLSLLCASTIALAKDEKFFPPTFLGEDDDAFPGSNENAIRELMPRKIEKLGLGGIRVAPGGPKAAKGLFFRFAKAANEKHDLIVLKIIKDDDWNDVVCKVFIEGEKLKGFSYQLHKKSKLAWLSYKFGRVSSDHTVNIDNRIIFLDRKSDPATGQDLPADENWGYSPPGPPALYAATGTICDLVTQGEGGRVPQGRLRNNGSVDGGIQPMTAAEIAVIPGVRFNDGGGGEM